MKLFKEVFDELAYRDEITYKVGTMYEMLKNMSTEGLTFYDRKTNQPLFTPQPQVFTREVVYTLVKKWVDGEYWIVDGPQALRERFAQFAAMCLHPSGMRFHGQL